jgi:hypothetical protein
VIQGCQANVATAEEIPTEIVAAVAVRFVVVKLISGKFMLFKKLV